MQELEQAVVASFRKLVADGALDAAIDKRVAETVGGIVADAFGRYSKFGKDLEEDVKSSLAVDVRSLGLHAYNHTILEVARRTIAARIDAIGAAEVEKQLTKLLDGDAPKTITLSKLVDDFKRWVREDYSGTKGRYSVTAIIETTQYKSKWLYLDPERDKEKYQCAFNALLSEDGTIHGLRFNGRDASKTLFIGDLGGFERTLFQLKLAGTRLVIDTEDLDVCHPDED